MAHLIDIALVVLTVGAALWVFIKYFVNLGQVPKDQPVSCGGCNSSCHDTSNAISVNKL